MENYSEKLQMESRRPWEGDSQSNPIEGTLQPPASSARTESAPSEHSETGESQGLITDSDCDNEFHKRKLITLKVHFQGLQMEGSLQVWKYDKFLKYNIHYPLLFDAMSGKNKMDLEQKIHKKWFLSYLTFKNLTNYFRCIKPGFES